MKSFKVKISEYKENTFVVEANTEKEAEIAASKYYNKQSVSYSFNVREVL